MRRWPNTPATTSGWPSLDAELQDLQAQRDELELAWLEAAERAP